MIKTKERINLDGLTYNIKQEIKNTKEDFERFLRKYINWKAITNHSNNILKKIMNQPKINFSGQPDSKKNF